MSPRASVLWVATQGERIDLLYWPRYGTERNANEDVNIDLNGGLNSQALPESKPQPRSRIQASTRRFAHCRTM